METIVLLSISVIWIVCGIFVYGRTLAFFQGEFPNIAKTDRKLDRNFALVSAAFGPFGLIVVLISGANHGYMWRLPRD